MGIVSVTDRESAVLSSFLFANDVYENLDDAFIMDVEIFSTNLKQRVAEKMNEETNGEQMYSYQNITIENKIVGTHLEQEWIDIIAQTPIPLSVAKRIYDDLVAEYKQRLARGILC